MDDVPESPPSDQDVRRVRSPVLKLLGCVVLPLILVAGILIPAYITLVSHRGVETQSADLRMLATAQMDFRANDRDGNGVTDFWTADIAGLYCIEQPTSEKQDSEPTTIRLIDLGLAGADANPLQEPSGPYSRLIGEHTNESPRYGAWYAALLEDRSTTPAEAYQTDTGGAGAVGKEHYHPSKFGYVAFPTSLSASVHMTIINETGVAYRFRLKEHAIVGSSHPPGHPNNPWGDGRFSHWPSKEDLEQHWSRLN